MIKISTFSLVRHSIHHRSERPHFNSIKWIDVYWMY